MRQNPKVHFEPRRKKLHGPSVVGMKTVRIDARTQIMVSADTPDDIARQRFLDRLNKRNPPDVKEEILKVVGEKLNGEEIPIGSLEEMVTLADDAVVDGE